MPTIEIENLAKTYPGGAEALRGVSLTLAPGEAVALLGSNGSGKSTLLRCITGLEKATAGRCLIDGVDMTSASGRSLRRVRRRVGMVFQRFHLIGGLSAYQNVLFGGLGSRPIWRSLNATTSATDRARALECLARVNMADLARQRADTLSGGQQQRVAIARTLMQDPEVLLADEPIASLDPKSGDDVMDLIWSIVRERGMSVICSLHQVDIAMRYADRIVGLHLGEKVIDAPRDSIGPDALRDLYDRGLRSSSPAAEGATPTQNGRCADARADGAADIDVAATL